MRTAGGRRRALLAGGAMVLAVLAHLAAAAASPEEGLVVTLGEEDADDALLALDAGPVSGSQPAGGKAEKQAAKQLARLRKKTVSDAKVKKQVEQIQRRKRIDKQVGKKVAKTLAKQMAAKDAAETKVSKAELRKEVRKEKAGFDEKQDIDQLNASRDAKKQAHGSNRIFAQNAHDLAVARAQAGESQKKLPPLKSMKDRVKDQEKALKDSDSQLLHVSKAELAREMAKISGAKKKPAAHTSEVDRMRSAIKHAQPVGVSNRGNPFHMSPADKHMIVKRPTIKNLGHAQATKAATQMKDVSLSNSEKRGAAQQSLTKMFTDSAQVKRTASAQAKGMHRLHGAKRNAARAQAKGMKLFPADERTAQKQLAVTGLSAHDKADAKRQMEIPVLHKGTGQRYAQRQDRMAKLSEKQRRAAALQVKTKLFKISHRNAVGAWRQANSQRFGASDKRRAASQAKWSAPAGAQHAAAVQATEQRLSASQRRAAREQDRASVLNQRDRNQAAEAATPDKLSSSDWQAAHNQAENGKLSKKAAVEAAAQDKQWLHQSDAMRAMAQARDAGISKRQQKLSRDQARGASFQRVKRFASKQDTSRLFSKPTAKVELAARLQTRQYVNPKDLRAAVKQTQGDHLNRAEEVVAAKQAAIPQLTTSRKAEADKLAHQQGYNGSVRAMAEKQANPRKVTLGESDAARRQASDRLKPAAMKLALRQASEDKLNKKDLKFALRQMKRMYGLSKTQAVDTVTKLTMEARLEALKQARQRLKKRDAMRAKQQAKEIRLSLQDEVAAERQVTDDKLSHLRKKDENYAQHQLKSEFAGRMTAENAKIAARLTDKAQKKHEKFMSEFQEWEEARREAKIRAKYARQREVMLGEAGIDAVQAPHKAPAKAAAVRRAPPAAKPLSGADFAKRLEKIRKEAAGTIEGIRGMKKIPALH